ncbi:dephospho-CoA kinase [Bifidobacterium bohemicum]|uniref:Dephospho-CoA kinase n=1 Tax=Bifidobacterium bohemicum DSM 22767 TaxID=1437606 RepID=A0A086ZJY7_9BIFI|nr:dephospho-CoA kinase [Bifidobacterium bohemicum]KFI46837.1 dephospho-CoA kinase [Bifidobacterium bohemicum DSM 22767]SCB82703.1 dephospho-CoA kinase [Bifidobacterium bohemicum]
MRIGLTGGIAAGKSTVAAHLTELGAVIIDYDKLARQVVAPGSPGLQKIVHAFGPEALMQDGSLDRAWLAGHVFGVADEGARRRLDAIEHPLVYQLAEVKESQTLLEHAHVPAEQTEEGRHAGGGRSADLRGGSCVVIVHDVPLLAEVIDEIPFDFDHIITVEAPEEVRVRRMMDTRAMSREQAEARISHQSTRAQREAIADVVVDATQPVEQMFEHVDMLIAQWQAC